MDSATAASLLETLESSHSTDLFNLFTSFLDPFSDFIPLGSQNPKKRKSKKATASTLRPLAKQFFPFLLRCAKILPGLLGLRSPNSSLPNSGDDERASQLLSIYRLVIDCLYCIEPCLVGNPHFVDVEKGILIRCLEYWGRYEEAEKEAISLLKALKLEQRERQSGGLVSNGVDPDHEVVILAVKVVTSLVGCAYKRKSKDRADYERILGFVQLVLPGVRALDPESMRKYYTLLMNALHKCALFLAGECKTLDGDLVRDFVQKTLRECLQSPSMDHFQNIIFNICRAIDKKLESRPLLIFDMLRINLENMSNRCKGGIVKAVNESFEFVSYSAKCFCAASVSICMDASELLYQCSGGLLQVSTPVASVMLLYATGLYFRASNVQSKQSGRSIQEIRDVLEKGEKLQVLVDSLSDLARYFHTKHEVDYISEVESEKHEACRHLHENAFFLSYLDALDFLCKLLVDYVDMAWEVASRDRVVCLSANINHVQAAFRQFCNLILVALKCTKVSKKDKDRLHESRKILLQVAASSLKISIWVSEEYQMLNFVIPSEWIEPQELKSLISVRSNIVAFLCNNELLKQASVALNLHCRTIWVHVKLLCQMYSNNVKGYNVEISKAVIESVTTDASERCAMIVDALHKGGGVDVHEIVVRTLVELSVVYDLFPDSTCLLALVKQWVKMLCKDYKEVDLVDNAPVLYLLLVNQCSELSKRTIGKILEQELLAYVLMEARNPELCQKKQIKVVDFLLDDVFIGKEYILQRSRILVKKARSFRAQGIESLNCCIKCLREAISLLTDISVNSSRKDASVYHQLAFTYLLDAQCTQEATQNREVILQDIQKALELLSSIDIRGQCSANGHVELSLRNTILLLCSTVDLLSMKGCLELQLDVCNMIMMFFKHENIPIEKCLAMLWSERRVNHSLCSLPIDENSILSISHYLDHNANSIDFWISCLKGFPSHLLALLQKLSLCESITPEVSLYKSEIVLGTKVTIDEVEKVASSLISDVPLVSQSASIAGYLYYDLSERLFSNGRLFQALQYARVALRLRSKILQRKFIYSFKEQSAESVELGKLSQKRHDHVCLEATGSVIIDAWPDTSKSSDLESSILTPWSVLRCYLESILQVGIINESIGNGAEAEDLFLIGKKISCLQDLPIFCINFMSLLGKIYRKKQQWDLAENELNSARSLLLENNMVISCKLCKLALEIFIDMQFGDLLRNRSADSSCIALGLYESAFDKLNDDKFKCAFSICGKAETVDALPNKPDMQDDKHEILKRSKMPSKFEVRPAACSICACVANHNQHHVRQMHAQNEKVLSNMEPEGSNLRTENKKNSRTSSKCLQKKHSLNGEPKLRTRYSKRTQNKSANVASGVDNNGVEFGYLNNFPDALNLENSQAILSGSSSTDFGRNKQCMPYKAKCWRCLLIEVMEDGNMKNIIYLKWERHRRCLLLRLLLKIAKSKHGAHETHEVHGVYWHCGSVMFDDKPLPHRYSDISDSCLIDLAGGEVTSDSFPAEHALLLYNMSWHFLKGCNLEPEPSRPKCCTLAGIHKSDAVTWLLKAFILCQELPLLFQKVSKLLASLLISSTVDDSLSIPFYSESSLSISHWAAYHHQAALGTYLPCQYLAYVKDKACSSKVPEDPYRVSKLDNIIEASNFLRFAPERIELLEEFVIEFFHGLPSVPIICISLLGGDYANLIGETLLIPSYFPAWMLVSRLNPIGQPITMLLPADHILEDVHLESMEWQCPWGPTIVDYVAPLFKHLLQENFSSSKMASTYSDALNWWTHRRSLDKRLKNFLGSMEDSWLGPWSSLLSGGRTDPDSLSKIVQKLIRELKFHYKFEPNDNLIQAILSGSKSASGAEACISQLILYKGYFGRGACCGEERLRAFCAVHHKGIGSMPESIQRLIREAIGEVAEPVDREPVILVLDSDVQMLSWENLPVLRSQEVYRMPSVGSISLTLKRCSHYHKQDKTFGAGFPSIDPLAAYYLLNPSGDLSDTQSEFEQWFSNQKWEGKAGQNPRSEELILALQNRDLFIYLGHGSGMQYIQGKEIQNLDRCAATLLMGCSSGSLTYKGCYAPQGAPLSYLFGCSPAIIANLWEVTDKDIDRFAKVMLKSWLEEEPFVPLEDCTRCNKLAKEFGYLEISDGGNATLPKTRRKAFKSKRLQQSNEKGKCKLCGRRRFASFMSEARDACKLPFLIGASPVCYGVPTVLVKK